MFQRNTVKTSALHVSLSLLKLAKLGIPNLEMVADTYWSFYL